MEKYQTIIDIIKDNPSLSSKEIFNRLGTTQSYATLKRILTKLKKDQLIISEGRGRGTTYRISPAYDLFYKINLKEYFLKEIDERKITPTFNLDLIQDVLQEVSLFTEGEFLKLAELQNIFQNNIAQLSKSHYHKEMERLAIDLSWKSSQIEGNTYTLLETERLLREKELAEGKKKEEAVMLLNHKEAIDLTIEDPTYLNPITTSRIEDIHSILINELGVERNIRKRRVGITGTNYIPLDNEFQIREAMFQMCQLINARESIFEKALLALVLISYIQPFSDGNKRTARIISNALLISYNYCPISFRTIDSIEYKKAMLIFYEQNNLAAFKQIFIDQFEFAVTTYF